MEKKVLVIEDEPSIVTLLQYNLNKAGFHVITASDGEEGLNKALTENPDFILLDLMLPKMDGLDVCKELRLRHIDTPILMLTAKDDEFDKVLGLELGADDYLTKPFSPREVVARVKAILRRTSKTSSAEKQEDSSKIQIGELVISPDQYEVYMNGEALE